MSLTIEEAYTRFVVNDMIRIRYLKQITDDAAVVGLPFPWLPLRRIIQYMIDDIVHFKDIRKLQFMKGLKK